MKEMDKMELREAITQLKAIYMGLSETWPSEAMKPIGIAIQCMMDAEKANIETKAPYVCCPECKVNKCAGRSSCPEIERWIERRREELETMTWIDARVQSPEEGQAVLITEDYDGKRKVGGGLYYSGSPFWKNHVVAWMPKPEPYTGDQNETGV